MLKRPSRELFGLTGAWGHRGRFELPHHHPGGRLHPLARVEGIGIQIALARSTGLPPLLLRFPSQPVGGIHQGKEITQVAAIDQDIEAHAPRFGTTAQIQSGDPLAAATYRVKLHPRPPLQQGLCLAPIPQDRFSGGWPVAEATHPVLVEALRFTALKFAQKGPPEPRLPGGELVAIRSAHPGGTHHSPQPRPWG